MATKKTEPQVDPRFTKSFQLFLAYMWKELGLSLPTPVQLDIAEFLQDGPKRRMVKGYRGVGKSWITASYVLWRLLKDPQERILVISASKDRADSFTRFTRRLIEDMPMLHHLKPRPGQADSVVSFEVGPAEASQSPSLKSVGIGGQITGSRASIIIADDIEVPSNSLTTMMRDRLAEAVKEFDAILVPGENSEVIYLGTDQTEASLYKRLPERGYEVKVWPVRVPRADKVRSYGDTLGPYVRRLIEDEAEPWSPVDPERFDEEDLLEREASYGRSGFAQQFMLDPALSDMERFPLKCSDAMVLDSVDVDQAPTGLQWSTRKDERLELTNYGLTGDRWHRALMPSGSGLAPFTGSVMFVDPSGKGSDETAWAVVKIALGRLFVTAIGSSRAGYDDEVLDQIVATAKEHKVNVVSVEPNFGGGLFNKLLQGAFAARGYACAIEDAPWAKGQKEIRIIETMEPLLNQHRLVFSRDVINKDERVLHDDSIPPQKRKDYMLFHQLTRITKERGSLRHDDRLDALAGACAYWTDQMARSEAQAEMDHRASLMDAEVEAFLEEIGSGSGGPTWNNPW